MWDTRRETHRPSVHTTIDILDTVSNINLTQMTLKSKDKNPATYSRSSSEPHPHSQSISLLHSGLFGSICLYILISRETPTNNTISSGFSSLGRAPD